MGHNSYGLYGSHVNKMKPLNATEASLLTIEQLSQQLQVNPANGLSWDEATNRLNSLGYNEFNVEKEESLLQKYIEQFKNPFV